MRHFFPLVVLVVDGLQLCGGVFETLWASTIRVPIDMPSTCGPHTIEMRPFSQQVTRSNSRATSHTSQGP
jgi:hypothetical protein